MIARTRTPELTWIPLPSSGMDLGERPPATTDLVETPLSIPSRGQFFSPKSQCPKTRPGEGGLASSATTREQERMPSRTRPLEQEVPGWPR